MSEGERAVHVIQLREDTELRATITTYRGAQYVGVRQYWRTPAGDWVPTKRGITISAERLDELELAIGALRRAVEAEPR